LAYHSEEERNKWHEHIVVVAGFRRWLESQGWKVETEREDIDVIATRGDKTIIAEAKGLTGKGKVKGMHTVYGQILRRMTPHRVSDPNTSFAVVVPAKSAVTAARVPKGIRDLLRLTVYSVTDEGEVKIFKNKDLG
jgi:hypothetical protein